MGYYNMKISLKLYTRYTIAVKMGYYNGKISMQLYTKYIISGRKYIQLCQRYKNIADTLLEENSKSFKLFIKTKYFNIFI